VPVGAASRDAEEERTRNDASLVVGEIADLDVPPADHVARLERPNQRLELHRRKASQALRRARDDGTAQPCLDSSRAESVLVAVEAVP
jgi:hypothetical protein